MYEYLSVPKSQISRNKHVRIFHKSKMILFLVQSKNMIFNHYALTKKNWWDMQNILVMGNKLYQGSSSMYIFS